MSGGTFHLDTPLLVPRPWIFSVSFENKEFAFASAGTHELLAQVPPQHSKMELLRTMHSTFGAWQAFMSKAGTRL